MKDTPGSVHYQVFHFIHRLSVNEAIIADCFLLVKRKLKKYFKKIFFECTIHNEGVRFAAKYIAAGDTIIVH